MLPFSQLAGATYLGKLVEPFALQLVVTIESLVLFIVHCYPCSSLHTLLLQGDRIPT